MKHLPFQSSYREHFEVVEQAQGNLRLFPHTDQLPALWRALHLEFHSGLPGYIARVDQRGDGYHKALRQKAAMLFCSSVNASHQDQLRLFPLLDPDLVCRLTIVQQLTQPTPRGPSIASASMAARTFPRRSISPANASTLSPQLFHWLPNEIFAGSARTRQSSPPCTAPQKFSRASRRPRPAPGPAALHPPLL